MDATRVFLAAATALLAAGSASAYTFQTIHTFCSANSCADGSVLEGGVTLDSAGNIYGATSQGGELNDGTIFELTKGSGGQWQHVILYGFCKQFKCADGIFPVAAPIVDVDGNLYGSASAGGSNEGGVLYELSPNKRHTSWKFEVIYSFCTDPDCPTGNRPQASFTYAGSDIGLPWDGKSPLYGTTNAGGAHREGTVFALTRQKKQWTMTVLYNFCAHFKVVCTDGMGPGPQGRLILDQKGNIFGTTEFGGRGDGVPGHGTIFELARKRDGTYSHKVLNEFCYGTGCPDGNFPVTLLPDGVGGFYGLTAAGGGVGAGSAFELSYADGAWSRTMVYSFCQVDDPECLDGFGPIGNLSIDGGGLLLGTTVYGGGYDDDLNGYGGGVVFALDPAKKQVTVIHAFCSVGDFLCDDGEYPLAGLTLGPGGVYYGTTEYGGPYTGGTVFQIAP